MTYYFIGTESVKRKTVQPRATEAEDLIAFIQELIFFFFSIYEAWIGIHLKGRAGGMYWRIKAGCEGAGHQRDACFMRFWLHLRRCKFV